MLDHGKDLLVFAAGTLAWGVTLGFITEAIAEAYREKPLAWLRSLLSYLPVVGKAQDCKKCWPLWVAGAVGLLVLVFVLKHLWFVASTVLAIPIAWRVSNGWHDWARKVEAEKDVMTDDDGEPDV